jgi:hypothetical protein
MFIRLCKGYEEKVEFLVVTETKWGGLAKTSGGLSS